MTRLIGIACALSALSAVGSGLLLAYTRTALLSGWLLAVGGGSGLVGLWLLDGTAVTAGQLVLVVAGLIFLPASLWAYPRPRWQHAVDLVLATALIGPGLMACFFLPAPGVIITLGSVSFLALVAQMWWRLESSSGAERRALAWVAWVVAVSVLVSLTLQFVAWDEYVVALSVAILAFIPMSMAIGVIRPASVDVRGLAVSSGVAVALALGYIAYFMTAVSLLDLAGVSEPAPSVLALVGLLGAVAVHPAGSALRGVMDEILFGGRPDPLAAATRVVDTIGGDPAAALTAVRTALALPYVALWQDDALLARSGEPGEHVRQFVASGVGGTTVVEVGMRPGDLRLSPGDARVLRLVTPLMVQLVRATELSAELQQSRAKALTAIADERRRLRNELHDDLGPTLTGIAMTTDAARNTVSDPAVASELLETVRGDVSAAIEQIRHLVYGMRPPALDEMGLVEALRQRALGLGREVQVQFEVPDDLGELPAAVEVAAYRIVMEALANVARHSDSQTATVTLARDALALCVEVTDQGGASGPWHRGVGLASMQDRVAELGGTLSAGPGEFGGEVRARLPLSV